MAQIMRELVYNYFRSSFIFVVRYISVNVSIVKLFDIDAKMMKLSYLVSFLGILFVVVVIAPNHDYYF